MPSGPKHRYLSAPTPEEWPDSRAQPRSFFGAPLVEDIMDLKADIAFVGMPFDQGTTNRPGARFGPNAIRDARGYSYTGWGEPRPKPAHGYFDIDAGVTLLAGVTMADCGDVTVAPSNAELGFDRLTRVVGRILAAGAFPVIVGGDHSITFPAVRAFADFGKIDIVHFDAHMDYSHDYQGVLYTHGSPIRRCAELPFVRGTSSIGIRVAHKKTYEEAMQRGVHVLTADQFRNLGPKRAMEQVLASDAIYLTIDIDVLDPIYAPGTGTPEPGGAHVPRAAGRTPSVSQPRPHRRCRPGRGRTELRLGGDDHAQCGTTPARFAKRALPFPRGA
jgi:agmatinase